MVGLVAQIKTMTTNTVVVYVEEAQKWTLEQRKDLCLSILIYVQAGTVQRGQKYNKEQGNKKP